MTLLFHATKFPESKGKNLANSILILAIGSGETVNRDVSGPILILSS